MILAEKGSICGQNGGDNQHVLFQILFLILRCIGICTHKLTNIHATLPIRIWANFHANTHTNTPFPSLTPNNCVVTSQIYSITATNPLTLPFFLLHLSILFILPLTSVHLVYTQEHFLGFQCGASCYILKLLVCFVDFFCLTCPLFLNVKPKSPKVPVSLNNDGHGERYNADLRDKWDD